MNVLFVHGALVRDGQWWWHRMVEPLTRRGLSTGAVVFPAAKEHLANSGTCTPTPLRSPTR